MDSFQNMSHTVIDSHIELDSSWITVMCRATRFHITVSYKDIERSRFGTEYSEMVAKAMEDDDEEDHDVLCEWIVDPCTSFFQESTVNVPKEITFEDFYYPQTHHLKLLVSGSSLCPKATRDRGTMDAFHFMIPSGDLPPFSEVPRSKASDLRIISDTKWDDYMSEIPQKALIGDGTSKFFKPADDKKQILREVDMHLRIRHAGLRDKIRIAHLHSIVVSDDAKMTIGLLFDLISSASDSLYSYKESALALEYHARWKQQITAIVEQLHSHDLVWGDVHPGNIVIDTSFDAWAVDFGGGSIEEFVPRKLIPWDWAKHLLRGLADALKQVRTVAEASANSAKRLEAAGLVGKLERLDQAVKDVGGIVKGLQVADKAEAIKLNKLAKDFTLLNDAIGNGWLF